jgi:hypothetical protein
VDVQLFPDQGRRNRFGCLLIGVAFLVALLLFVAIGLGWLGSVDTGKNSAPAIADNRT